MKSLWLNSNFLQKNTHFFLLFTASFRLRKPESPLVPGVFYLELSQSNQNSHHYFTWFYHLSAMFVCLIFICEAPICEAGGSNSKQVAFCNLNDSPVNNATTKILVRVVDSKGKQRPHVVYGSKIILIC